VRASAHSPDLGARTSRDDSALVSLWLVLEGAAQWATVAAVPFELQPEAWMRDGACQEHPEINWFPERGENSEPAKQVCRNCLVQRECLAHGLGIGHGIWGGSSERERRVLRSKGISAELILMYGVCAVQGREVELDFKMFNYERDVDW
jgi:WhiB family redox-sensing transcriptional regulator